MHVCRPTLYRWLTTASMTLAFGPAGCDSHDLGKPCPDLLDGEASSSDGSRLETQEIVGIDVTFPCEEFVCIATDGRPGYCSKKCRDDAGCADGFACRVVQETGPFAGAKFCAWERCAKASDCGNIKEFCCKAVPSVDPNEEIKLCAFSDDALCDS